MKWLRLALQAIYLSLAAWRNLALTASHPNTTDLFDVCPKVLLHLYAVLIVLTVARAAQANESEKRDTSINHISQLHFYISLRSIRINVMSMTFGTTESRFAVWHTDACTHLAV